MNSIRRISFCFFVAFIFSCSTSNSNSEVYVSNNCPAVFHKINFKDLIDSISVYNNKYIEVTGFYTWHIEETAISESRRKTKSKIWVVFDAELSRKSGDTTVNLIETRAEFDKIIEKMI